jgi:hypothetical protein
LIDLAAASVSKRVLRRGERLTDLRHYRHHATYLGQLNLSIGAYNLISDDGRYDALHERLSTILYAALTQSDGRPLMSLPGEREI